MPPRASNAAKRQQGAANQRDTRHENGLVGPGKRVQKQQSNGHINGHAKSSETSPSTPPTSATPPHANGHVRLPASADSMADYKMSIETVRRHSSGGYSESSSSEYGTPTMGGSHEVHRQIDVNAAKNSAVHRDAGPLGFAFTVLRSCPLYDTIAILIVLLQIPPAFLSLIHLLFAFLTFVPPSTSASSGLSFTDIFEGTLGTPSITTIVVVDLIVLLVWLFLWSPLQDIALDLAQTVIALTLGGGTSGREAGMNNVILCFGIIGVSHLARSGGVKQTGLRTILSTSGGWLGAPDPDDPLEPMDSTQKRVAPGWIRSILAIHILTQGVVRYVRDWYVRREKGDVSSFIGDPEAAKGSLTDPTVDSSTPIPQTPDLESPGSLPLASNSLTSKKKKKQSALVRIRQPLWAALASTKIVMVKEYESSHIAAESAGANATDVNNLGNAPFGTESDRIWISYIGSDEISFGTSHFPSHLPGKWQGKSLESPAIDRSKPFFVRVNKTIWQPTRITSALDVEHPGQAPRWSGEIFGLAPMSNYEVEFISTTAGAAIFSTSVRTLQPPALTTLSPNPAVTGRPGSPTTTLKTSIATSEVKLVEERTHLKRDRKEQRTKVNALRREIDKLSATIANSGGSDDRLRQKVHQSQLHMKQAEDALSALSSSIDVLNQPSTQSSSSILPTWKSQKALFSQAKESHETAHQDFTTAKTAAEQALTSLSSDLSSLQQKRERMQSRITKLQSEHERISDANARGLDEATRRSVRDAERSRTETLYLERLQASNAQIAEAMNALGDLYASIEGLQQYEQFATQQTTQSPANAYADTLSESSNTLTPSSASYAWFTPSLSLSSPLSLSNPHSHLSAPNSAHNSISFPSGTTLTPWLGNSPHPPSHSHSHSATQSLGAVGTPSQSSRSRARSSSMLSNVSTYTQSEVEGGMAKGQQHGGSNGSGSRSGSGSGVWNEFGVVGQGLGVGVGMGLKGERERSGSGSGEGKGLVKN